MQRHALISTAIGAVIAATGPTATACDRRGEVSNVRAGAGPVMVAIYTEEGSFMKRPARGLRLAAEGSTVSFPLCDIGEVDIAVMVFQDLNTNGKMDFNPFGMPIEPYGASGSPGFFGPPSWAAAKVRVGDVALRVVLSQ